MKSTPWTGIESQSKKGRFRKELRKNYVLFLMLIPAFLFFLINNYLPMAGIYLAFTKFNFRGGIFGSPFIGLKNFEFLFNSNILIELTRNTLLYNAAFILINNIMQIFMAILITQMRGRYFKKTAQTLIFLPYFVSMVILGAFTYNLFNYEYGVINTLLKNMGIKPVDIYGMVNAWPVILVLFNLWKGLGYGSVVYIAVIKGISIEYYEAAEIDGAGTFKQIRYITLPLLKPTFFMLMLFAVGGIMLGNFDLFWQTVGNNGRLFPVADIIDTYVYRTLMMSNDIGLSSAASLYQSVFGLVFVITVNAVVKKLNSEYALF